MERALRADRAGHDIEMEIRLYQPVSQTRPLARELWKRVERHAAP
ncbi:hypothetical protein [Bordetella avium]|nr:hypothetical protein [Bordetella avium]